MASPSNRTLFHLQGKSVVSCQQAHEKMLNITKHHGNANQNHSEISPHTCQNGYQQKDLKSRMQSKGNTCTLLVECKFVQPVCKQVWGFLKKLKKNRTTYDPAIPLLELYPKKSKNTNLTRHVHPNVYTSIIYNCLDMETT